MRQIPADRRFQLVLKRMCQFPAQFAPDPRGIDCIAIVVTGAISDMDDRASMVAPVDARGQAIEDRTDRLYRSMLQRSALPPIA